MGLPWIAPIVVSLWFGGTDPATARAVAQRVLDDGRYQVALDDERRWRRAGPSSSGGVSVDRRTFRGRPGGDNAPAADILPGDDSRSSDRSTIRSGGGGSSSGTTFLTVVAVLGALLVVGVVLASLLQRRRLGPLPRAADVAAAPPPEPDLARPLDEAEQLASEGKYDQAVHVLLLRSLRVLAESQGLPVSLTSREIVRDVTMPDDAREALAELVGEVETSLFGGRAVDAPSWARCRERYASFVAILRGANAGSRA
ncbi:MAG: DUF4129 domain-containing protein [Planctomycetes bacterium]|nr:DUF4129 domain-containing protein [Planctomycetota bacterium]MCB9826060.1 DUF4129 domain-containing protein [Planctomycetota bacterium]MCB9829184.1 DUF4129 domain-containing protein [Planctomycetota bacterium]